jgi:hypothetical protein
MFGGGLVSPKRARNTACAGFWQIFTSNKSEPANRKGEFYTNCLPKNEEIRGIFVKAAKTLNSVSKFKI